MIESLNVLSTEKKKDMRTEKGLNKENRSAPLTTQISGSLWGFLPISFCYGEERPRLCLRKMYEV